MKGQGGHLAASASHCTVPESCGEGPVSQAPTQGTLMAEAGDLPARRREQAELH